MQDNALNRRRFMNMSGLGVLGVISVACGGSDTKDLAAPAGSTAAAPATSAAAASTAAAATTAAGASTAESVAASTAEATAAASSAPTATFPAWDPATEKGALQVFDWAGYEIKEFWDPYNNGPYGKSNPLKFSFLENDQQALAKVAGGYTTDVSHPCIAYVKDWLDAGLIQAWNTDLIPEYASINPALAAPGVIDGQVYAIPWDWGFSAPVYNADKVDPKEMSWNIFLDERYKGRMSFFNDGVAVIKVGGLINGVADPQAMNDEEIEAAKQTMLKAKPLLRSFWGSETDTINDFVAGNIDVTYGWPGTWYQIKNKMKGANIQYMAPKEGRLGWICCYLLMKDTPRAGLAHEMQKAALNPQSMANLINLYAYGAANVSSTVLDLVKDKSLITAFQLDDPSALDPPKVWSEKWLPNRADYVKAFEEIQAS